MASNPFGGSTGGLNPTQGGAARTPKVRPNRSIIRLAGRLATTKNGDNALIAKKVGEALTGWTPEQVARIADKANVAPDQLLAIQKAIGTAGAAAQSKRYVGSVAAYKEANYKGPGEFGPLVVLGAPVRAALSAIAESGREGEKKPINLGPIHLRFGFNAKKIAEAAGQGALNKRHDTPTSIAVESGKARKAQGVSTKSFGVLPGTDLAKGQALPGGQAGRIGYEVGGSIATDPTTYLSFGTSALANTAARSAAPILAESRGLIDAAEAAKIAETGVVTANPQTRQILADLLSSGTKGLSKSETAKLGPDLVKQLRGARGGVKVLGHSVPGTQLSKPLMSRFKTAIAARTTGGKAIGNLEELGRTVAGTRQLERVGELPTGATGDVQNILGRFNAGTERGLYATEMAARVTRDLAPEELAHVQAALDIGGPKLVTGLSEKERAAFDTLNQIRENSTGIQTSAGLLQTPEQLAAGGVQSVPPAEYYPMFRNPESGPMAARGAPLSGRQAPNLMARSEASRFTPAVQRVDEAGNPSVILHPGIATALRAQLAERDVAKVNLVRDLSSLSDTSGNKLLQTTIRDASGVEKSVNDLSKAELDTLVRSGDWQVKELPRTTVGPNGVIDTTQTEKVLVHSAIAKDFDRASQLLAKPSEASAWLSRGIDKFDNLWKAYATAFGPFGGGFAMRNAQGNLINGFWLTGTEPIVNMTRAGRLQMALTKGVREGDMWKYMKGGDQAAVQDAIDHGVLNAGFFHDIGNPEKFGKTSLLKERLNPLSLKNYAISGGHYANSWIEQNARLGLFLGQRAKGLSAADAAQVVRKYLFDYADLSSADRAIKKVSPFFTWMRKNLPLQLETALKNPGKLTAQMHAIEGLQATGPNIDPKLIPGWQRDANAILVNLPGVAGGGQGAFIPDIPLTSIQDPLAALTGLGKLGEPGGLKEEIRRLVNAAGLGGLRGGGLSAALQVATGGQAFSGAPFQPGAGVNTPSYLGNLTPLGGPNISPFGSKITPENQFLLEQLLPGLSKLRGVAPTNPSDQSAQMRRLASILTGQSVWPVTKRGGRNEAFRRLSDLQTLQRFLSDRGAKIPAPSSGGQSGGSNPFSGSSSSSSSNPFTGK